MRSFEGVSMVFQHKKTQREYVVHYVPKSRLGAAYGIARITEACVHVRDNLPGPARKFVTKHELFHLIDKKIGVTAFKREFRANLYATWQHPIGFLFVLFMTLFTAERRALYRDRFKKGY